MALVEPDVDKLQAMYQSILDRYHFTWLDFDIEGKAMKDHDANHRRNTVIKNLQAKNPALIISFTVPVDPDGMNAESIKMMTDAAAQGVKIHSANVMTMFFGPKFNKTMTMMQMCTASANKAPRTDHSDRPRDPDWPVPDDRPQRRHARGFHG